MRRNDLKDVSTRGMTHRPLLQLLVPLLVEPPAGRLSDSDSLDALMLAGLLSETQSQYDHEQRDQLQRDSIVRIKLTQKKVDEQKTQLDYFRKSRNTATLTAQGRKNRLNVDNHPPRLFGRRKKAADRSYRALVGLSRQSSCVTGEWPQQKRLGTGSESPREFFSIQHQRNERQLDELFHKSSLEREYAARTDTERPAPISSPLLFNDHEMDALLQEMQNAYHAPSTSSP